MATLVELLRDGELVDWTREIAEQLPAGWQPVRRFIVTPDFDYWAEHQLPELEAIFDEALSVLDQFEGALEDYVAGRPVPLPRRMKMWRRTDEGVWYLKTNDLRIFGWFVQRDTFIAAQGASAFHAKTYDLYNGYVGQVLRFRNLLNLDEPKFVQGSGEEDVLSI
jgi:hypothetical protein